VISDPVAAKLARLVLYAMDMHVTAPANLTPPADPRMTDWRLLAHIYGQDRVLPPGSLLQLGGATCYGFMAQSLADSLQYVAVIRGTNGTPEWIKDALFAAAKWIVGKREVGFGSVYDSLGLAGVAGPLSTSITALLPPDARIKVIGHSLGAAEATYLTFELAKLLGDAVSGLFFASPRPGNAIFAQAFDALVKDYTVYDYELDIVPKVPFGPDYQTLPRAKSLSVHDVQARIAFDFAGFHHITSYMAELDYPTFLETQLTPMDRILTASIKGPA
jgi:triacylglycerol lipase